MLQTEVIIVGAGPTGLTVALELARRGIRSVLLERHDKPLFLPKMERTNPRSMEIFRRIGVADKIRAAGYPADVAMDAFIVGTLAENDPFVQLEYPSVSEAKAQIARCHDGSMPREPYQLISQYTLEPLLLEEAKKQPLITVRQGCEFLSLEEDGEGVTALVRDSGGEHRVRGKYLAACDGGTSAVRKQLGITLDGTGVLSTLKQLFFRCDDLFEKSKVPPGRHYAFVSREGEQVAIGGFLVVQDDRKHFTLQTSKPDDTDWVAELRRVTGLDINPEILFVGEWRQNLMVANRYQSEGGRVFLAGDAVHLFIPAGGLGMNTGVCDGYDLAWKLAGAVQGWGGPGLLASYDIERRPMGHRNTSAAGSAVEAVAQWRNAFTEKVFDKTPEGLAARAAFSEIAARCNRHVYEMKGTELGYRYQSPIVCEEAGTPPADDIFHYVPSTWPGCRIPHVWREDGQALHDQIGNGYTLLCLGGKAQNTSALEAAFIAQGAPFAVMAVGETPVREIYGYDLVLVRPDLHVCWRGNQLPADVAALARKVTGW